MAERPVCEVWADHEWSEPRFQESGRHDVLGPFNRYVRQCARCGRTTIETQWAKAPAVMRLPSAQEG